MEFNIKHFFSVEDILCETLEYSELKVGNIEQKTGQNLLFKNI